MFVFHFFIPVIVLPSVELILSVLQKSGCHITMCALLNASLVIIQKSTVKGFDNGGLQAILFLLLQCDSCKVYQPNFVVWSSV